VSAVQLFFALALLTAPLAAEGAAGKVHRIGYLAWHAPSEIDEATQLSERMRELGWVEGQNLLIESRYAAGQPERLPGLAAELVRLSVDVIVASRTPSALAAKKATTTIPIVFTGIADPVRAGLVPSLARPTGNLTGFSTSSAELSAKRLELLKATVPRITEVAVIVNPESPQSSFMLEDTRAAAGSLGVTLRPIEVRSAESMERALARNATSVGALLVLPDPLHNPPETQRRMASLALRHRLPLMAPYRLSAEAGALMSYGSREDVARPLSGLASYVDRILRGARPGELPVQQPTNFHLVVNLKTAKTLGLTIPQSVLLRADQVIGVGEAGCPDHQSDGEAAVGRDIGARRTSRPREPARPLTRFPLPA
jgi:ABC-type uncharacterized transport system substrate-binding protein